jgi:hypothetical protein
VTTQRHIVRRQLIELEMPARMNRVEIQNRVAQLFYDRLLPVIDKFLSQKSDPERTDSIETLEIDLGRLHISRLEEDLLDRIEEELQSKLNPIMKDLEAAAAAEKKLKPRNGSDIELIIFFLQTGSFPWWAVDSSGTALEQAFEKVAKREPSRLRTVLNSLLRDDEILQRCVYACSEKMLERIVEICLPGEVTRLSNAKKDISTSLGSFWSKPPLRQIWWYCVIRSMVVPSSEAKKNIVPGIVQLFVNLAGLSQQEIQLMEDSGVQLPENSSHSNNELEVQLETEIVTELSAQLDIVEGAILTISFFFSNERMEQIIEHLKNVEGTIQQTEAQEKATIRFDSWKKALKELFVIQKIIATQENPDHPLTEKEIQKQEAAIINGIQRIEQALTRKVSEINTTNNREERTSPMARDRMPARLKKLWQRQTKKAKLSKKLYDPFSDSDKVYVQNAGLVLLWPYLNRFFINMELADDKAFINEDAAERACLILQYLVEGNTEDIFEAQLPLNKIICGLDLNQPVNTQLVLDADEQEVADGLLEAVIQNAPLWKNLSPDSFRQAYLRREGILGTRDGHWLLQVKRETYDVMLDRLPWTIQVVKLPWMEQLIFVEWQQT